MTRIIAVANQKGGVGKTTTVLNLGAALQREGQRVLLVDLDPQAALSASLKVHAGEAPNTTYQVLLGQTQAALAVRPTHTGADLIPASIDLAASELELAGQMGREHVLGEALAAVSENYDFILIDCPPSFGLLTVNALVAAGEVLIPLQADYLSMRGLSLLLEVINKVKSKLKPELAITGILVTMYSPRTIHAREVLEEVRNAFGGQVFPIVIPGSVRFKEAPAAGLSIFDYTPGHEGAVAYENLAKELLK